MVMTNFVWLCETISVILWCRETHGYVRFEWLVILWAICILIMMFWCLYVSSPFNCGGYGFHLR